MKMKLNEKTNSADSISLGLIKTKVGLGGHGTTTFSQQSEELKLDVQSSWHSFSITSISLGICAAPTSKTQIYSQLFPAINLFTTLQTITSDVPFQTEFS